MSNADEQERQRTVAGEFLSGKIQAEDALGERDYLLRRFKTTWCRKTPGSYSVMAFAVGLNYVAICSEDNNNKFSKLQNEDDNNNTFSKLPNEEDKNNKFSKLPNEEDNSSINGVFFVTG